MWERTKSISLRISSVLSKLELEPDLHTGSDPKSNGSDRLRLRKTGDGHGHEPEPRKTDCLRNTAYTTTGSAVEFSGLISLVRRGFSLLWLTESLFRYFNFS